MDLELCYYLRSTGDGLESLLRTIVDHVVKVRLYDWRRDIELCSFCKNLLQPDLGLCNFAVAAFSYTYT